jgi:hypothetical protein
LAATLPFIHDLTMLSYFGPLVLLMAAWEFSVGRRLTYERAATNRLAWPAIGGLALPVLSLTLAMFVTSDWRL